MEIASGYSADLIPSTGTLPAVAVYGTAHQPIVLEGPTSSSLTAVSMTSTSPLPQPGSVLLTSGEDVYVQQPSQYLGLMDVTEVDTGTGTLIASYQLPRLRPDSVAGAGSNSLGGPTSAPLVGTVASLILDGGSLYALQYTGQAASIDDLTTGKVAYLPGYGGLAGGVLAADGSIYTVGWRVNDPSLPMSVLQIDPTSLSTTSVGTTGLAAATELNVQMQASSTENALLYIVEGSSTGPIDSYIWSVGSSGLTTLYQLPANVGLYMGDFGPTVYLFGGPAQNRVSSLNLTNGVLSQDLAGMASPSGTYVLALQ